MPKNKSSRSPKGQTAANNSNSEDKSSRSPKGQTAANNSNSADTFNLPIEEINERDNERPIGDTKRSIVQARTNCLQSTKATPSMRKYLPKTKGL